MYLLKKTYAFVANYASHSSRSFKIDRRVQCIWQIVIVFLQKLTGSQPIKKFPAFYGTRRFIIVFTRARQRISPSLSQLYPFRNSTNFYGEELLAVFLPYITWKYHVLTERDIYLRGCRTGLCPKSSNLITRKKIHEVFLCRGLFLHCYLVTLEMAYVIWTWFPIRKRYSLSYNTR